MGGDKEEGLVKGRRLAKETTGGQEEQERQQPRHLTPIKHRNTNKRGQKQQTDQVRYIKIALVKLVF